MGAFGFQRLRRTIAHLCPQEIQAHYDFLLDNLHYLFTNKAASDQYDAYINVLYDKYPSHRKVLNFLYASDVDALLTYGTAKQLLQVIGDYDDDVIYGYAGWGDDAARFKDFKELLQDAANTKTKWGWY